MLKKKAWLGSNASDNLISMHKLVETGVHIIPLMWLHSAPNAVDCSGCISEVGAAASTSFHRINVHCLASRPLNSWCSVSTSYPNGPIRAAAGSLIQLHSSAWQQGRDTHSRAEHSAHKKSKVFIKKYFLAISAQIILRCKPSMKIFSNKIVILVADRSATSTTSQQFLPALP